MESPPPMPTEPTGPAGAATARMPSEGSEPQPEGGSAVKGDSLDVWLQRHLHQSYDGTATQPIPEELLRLIEDDDKARALQFRDPTGSIPESVPKSP
jgi:hypothetical protein